MKLPGILRRRPTVVPTGRLHRVVVLVLGVLVLAGAGTQLGVAWATALPAGAVLRESGQVVTKADFQQRIHVLQALYGVTPPQGGPDLDKFTKDAAKSIAVSMILERAAADRHIVIADKAAQDALSNAIDKQPQGRAAFDQFLASQGISEQEVIDELKRQLATNQLFGQVSAGVPAVTDTDVQQEYQRDNAQMVTPEHRHLRNIVVASQQQADQILAQARGGADFAALAAQNSQDASTKAGGGDLGTLTGDQLDPAFGKAAFAAPANSYFGPVQTQYGWNVGQVLEVQPGQQLTLDQARDQIKTDLTSKRKLDVWRGWLGGQIAAAQVQYAHGYQPDDPDAPPADSPQ